MSGSLANTWGWAAMSQPSPPPSIALASVALVLMAILLLWRLTVSSVPAVPLPPIAPGHAPVLGHLLKVASPMKMRHSLLRWGDQFDGQPIFRLHLGQHTVMVLNTLQAVEDLLAKRGAIYSGRPMDFAGRHFFTNDSTALTPYGKTHRLARTIINKAYSPAAAKAPPTLALIERESDKLVHRLRSRIAAGDQGREMALDWEITVYAYSLVFSNMFGGQDVDPAVIKPAMDAVTKITKSKSPGPPLATAFPSLEKLPWLLDGTVAWVKGARQDLLDIFTPRYAAVMDNVRREREYAERNEIPPPDLRIEPDCHARNVAEAQLDGAVNPARAAWLIAGLISASGDTTQSSISWTLNYLAEYPGVQDKARRLLRSFVDGGGGDEDTTGDGGPGGRPSFAEPKTPEQVEATRYIWALVKEQSRISPAAPTSGPREVDQDDVYRGMSIPKGSMVFLNLWHLSRDPKVFPDPLRFDPERWLVDGKVDRVSDLAHDVAPFGFARRVCPGLHMAGQSMQLVLSHLIWNFRIERRPDAPSDYRTVEDMGDGSVVVQPADRNLVFVPLHT
ncbi:unnamed protein product [Parajaminaea phylloscopi]